MHDSPGVHGAMMLLLLVVHVDLTTVGHSGAIQKDIVVAVIIAIETPAQFMADCILIVHESLLTLGGVTQEEVHTLRLTPSVKKLKKLARLQEGIIVEVMRYGVVAGTSLMMMVIARCFVSVVHDLALGGLVLLLLSDWLEQLILSELPGRLQVAVRSAGSTKHGYRCLVIV